MASGASRQRAANQRWAEPGSAHDRLVKWTKMLLPAAAGVLIVILALEIWFALAEWWHLAPGDPRRAALVKRLAWLCQSP